MVPIATAVKSRDVDALDPLADEQLKRVDKEYLVRDECGAGKLGCLWMHGLLISPRNKRVHLTAYEDVRRSAPCRHVSTRGDSLHLTGEARAGPAAGITHGISDRVSANGSNPG
jgi:hypothetical protein